MPVMLTEKTLDEPQGILRSLAQERTWENLGCWRSSLKFTTSEGINPFWILLATGLPLETGTFAFACRTCRSSSILRGAARGIAQDPAVGVWLVTSALLLVANSY